MFKILMQTYMQTRINSIDAEIENLSEILVDEEEKAKTVIAKTTFEYSVQTTKRIRKLKSRLALYLILFGDIK